LHFCYIREQFIVNVYYNLCQSSPLFKNNFVNEIFGNLLFGRFRPRATFLLY
jgi:hypothetical protein